MQIHSWKLQQRSMFNLWPVIKGFWFFSLRTSFLLNGLQSFRLINDLVMLSFHQFSLKSFCRFFYSLTELIFKKDLRSSRLRSSQTPHNHPLLICSLECKVSNFHLRFFYLFSWRPSHFKSIWGSCLGRSFSLALYLIFHDNCQCYVVTAGSNL